MSADQSQAVDELTNRAFGLSDCPCEICAAELLKFRAAITAALGDRYQSTTLPDIRMSDELMDNLLTEISAAAEREDLAVYGLPLDIYDFMQSARAQIEWHVSAMLTAHQEEAAAERHFERMTNANGEEPANFGEKKGGNT